MSVPSGLRRTAGSRSRRLRPRSARLDQCRPADADDFGHFGDRQAGSTKVVDPVQVNLTWQVVAPAYTSAFQHTRDRLTVEAEAICQLVNGFAGLVVGDDFGAVGPGRSTPTSRYRAGRLVGPLWKIEQPLEAFRLVRRPCRPLAGGILGDENRAGPFAEPGFSMVPVSP